MYPPACSDEKISKVGTPNEDNYMELELLVRES